MEVHAGYLHGLDTPTLIEIHFYKYNKFSKSAVDALERDCLLKDDKLFSSCEHWKQTKLGTLGYMLCFLWRCLLSALLLISCEEHSVHSVTIVMIFSHWIIRVTKLQ